MKIYDYIFFRYYTSTLLSGEKQAPQVAATFQLTTIDLLITMIAGYLLVPVWVNKTLVGKDWYFYAIVTCVFFIPNYFLFLHRSRWKKIVERFGGESKRARKIGTVLDVVLSILVIVLAVYVQSAMSRH
jgi:hypothetical protein